VLVNEQISGAVTEVNAECYAALNSLIEICELAERTADIGRLRDRAEQLKTAINRHLIDPTTGLYVRNIDLEGNVYTQATVDMVFPLICGVADESSGYAMFKFASFNGKPATSSRTTIAT